jgi:GR25 family glycosyltransferase involved in LPS biosynthesis
MYVINLDERPDRMAEFKKNTKKIEGEIMRVKGVSKSELNLGYKNEQFVPKSVAACWFSHQLVAKRFLESGASHALIFEDDAVIRGRAAKFINSLNQEKLFGIDVFQIGYLTHNLRLDFPEFDKYFGNWLDLRTYTGESFSSLDIVYRNWLRATRTILRYALPKISRLVCIFNSKIENRMNEVSNYFRDEFRIRRLLGTKAPLVYHSFEPGTHAYVINRDFATAMIEINSPVYLAADLLLMAIAKSRNFKILRLSKSLVAQSNSPSSIMTN